MQHQLQRKEVNMNATATLTKTSSKREVTPRLTCLITGQSRLTNQAYLESKSQKAGSVETYLNNYISRAALKLLRAGKTVEETRQELGITDYNRPVSAEVLKRAIALNGKHRSE